MIDRGAARLLGATGIAVALAAASPAAAEPVEIHRAAIRAPGGPLILASGALVGQAATPAQQIPRQTGELAMDVRQGIGCLLVGTAGTTVTLAVGALNLVPIITGGVAAAHTAGALYLSLTGVIFGAFCAIGAAMTPLYVHLTAPRQAPQPAPRERHAASPQVPASFEPATELGTAAFRSGVLTNALAQRELAR